LIRRVSFRASSVLVDVDTHPDGQDNARKLHCTPHGEFTRPIEHRAGTRNQFRVQHELRKRAQRLDRNRAAVGYAMKQCSGSPMDVIHRHNALFVPVTVTEMSVLVALADLFWPQAMWNVS
jgi:hypothetical protein